MSFKLILAFIFGLVFSFKSLSSTTLTVGEKMGYSALIAYENGFLAAGSDGRIDWISSSGIVTKSEKYPSVKFSSLLAYDQMIVAAGDKGNILVSTENKTFNKVESGTDLDIHTLAFFKGKILAGTNQGLLLIGDGNGSFQQIQLALSGNIVSLFAGYSDCFGVTDKGEIIRSKDAINWSVFDFNEFYKDYYKPCHFTRISVTENCIAIIGIHEDGTPALLFSSEGNVWTERSLGYNDEQGMPAMLDAIPNDLYYDPTDDQFLLCCSKGKLMVIPSCSHCNKLYEFIQADFNAISGNGNTWMMVGEDFCIKTIQTSLHN
jgi:hypothetical protein